MKQVLCQVVSNESVMHGVRLAWFESPDIAHSAKPGQFVMVKCGEDNFLRRPFSIYQTDDNKGIFAVLYATVGKGTIWLSEQRVDSIVDILGPLGNGFTIYPKSHNLLLIAGGIGLAPLNFLAIEARNKGCSVTIRQGAKSIAHVFKDEYKPAMVNFTTVTEDGSNGEKGLAIDNISELINQTDRIYACGPLEMYRTMAQMPELKNKPVQLSLEIMMGCGMGVCYGCTIKTKQGLKQVCKDGPVFDMGDVVWEEFEGL